ncbi:hypothetical protein Xoosp13_65 [Xanthomonas phage Xoo-sp13]|nr:hypothetical protein Xoosp13_65 [Xanthomonas phage Xoo-sp13]
MNTQYGTEEAIAFLNGTGTDAKGRTVAEYLQFTPDKWEECHDHIQWAFPSHIPSQFNPNAPVVNMDEFTKNLPVKGLVNMMNLVVKYLESLGFTETMQYGEVHWSPPLSDAYWLTPRNHNYQRISRLLNLLAWVNPTLGRHLLKQFLNLAELVANKTHIHYRSDAVGYVTSPIITVDTVVYWSKAAIGHL